MINIVRLKSDNYDCFVCEDAYKAIILEMSSGDYGSHRARFIQVSLETLERLRWHSGHGLISYYTDGNDYFWAFYDGNGDCFIEPAS
jgi:hypothetical protein